MSSRTQIDRLFAGLERAGERVALVADRDWSYAELDLRGRRYGGALLDTGLQPGDRVAVIGEPSAELVAVMLGCYRAGLVFVPINPGYRGGEIGHILADSGARMLVCDPAIAFDPGPGVQRRTLGGRDPDALGLRTPIDRLPKPDAVAMLIYTSGTTGPSKGVALGFDAIVANMTALCGLWGMTAGDRVSLSLPLFHVHGLCIGIHGTLCFGASAIVHRRFDPETTVADFASRGATMLLAVPTMYAKLLAWLDEDPARATPLRDGRLFTSGSAALAPAFLTRFEALTGHRIVERYGMSETLITASNPLTGERRAGTVGRPVPGVQTKIVADDDQPVPAGDAGELWVRTPGMMTGYWNNPDATAQAFCEGWFRTGDVAVAEADGYIRIVGRRSVDIIKTGGFKVAAPEIEAVLLRHPAVAEVAVVGIPDPVWGQRVCAAVVLTPDAEAMDQGARLAELATMCREHLADHKTPRALVVLPALPRNALGKLQKREIGQLASRRRVQ